MDVLTEFGRAACLLRKRQQLTLDDLALSLGLDRSYLSEVERGWHDVGLRYIARLARGLGVEIVDFFWGGRTPTPRRLMKRVESALDRLLQEIIEIGSRDLAEQLLGLLRQDTQKLEGFLKEAKGAK